MSDPDQIGHVRIEHPRDAHGRLCIRNYRVDVPMGNEPHSLMSEQNLAPGESALIAIYPGALLTIRGAA